MSALMRLSHRLSTWAIPMALAACAAAMPAPAAAQTTVVAQDAWMREPLPNRSESAIFVVLENTGTEARSVVSASTAIAEKTELHNMSMENGMMKMAPVKAIELKAKAKTELKPGSYHIMVFGLKEKPAAGATVPLTLTLDNGQTLAVTATVRKVEGMRK